MLTLTTAKKRCSTAARARPSRRPWSCSCATPRRWAPSDSSTRATSPAYRDRRIRFCRTTTRQGADGLDAIFSHFDLDSDELVEVPPALVQTCHLQGGADPGHWQTLGAKPEVFRNYQEREAFAAQHGVRILKTCTPYLAGNVPAKGEHCAWMESSAVVYANSVLGARTNTEGRESTSAAMLTGKIPDWGLHRTENRFGTHRIDVELTVECVMDWGMLGYFVGDVVQERIPGPRRTVRRARDRPPQALRRGGLFFRRRRDVPHRRRHRKPRHSRWRLGRTDRSRHSATAKRSGAGIRSAECQRQRSECRLRDARMSACGARADPGGGGLLDGKRVSAQLQSLDFHVARGGQRGATARVHESDQRCRRCGDDRYVFGLCAGDSAGDEGGCARFGEAGALSAGDYGVQAWFGSTRDCIKAAVTGRWNGERP